MCTQGRYAYYLRVGLLALCGKCKRILTGTVTFPYILSVQKIKMERWHIFCYSTRFYNMKLLLCNTNLHMYTLTRSKPFRNTATPDYYTR